MEKGKLIVTKEGNEHKAYIESSKFKKPFKIGKMILKDNSLNNKDISFEIENGFIKKVFLDKVEIFPEFKYKSSKENTNEKSKINNSNENNYQMPIGSAKAPYNFIPLQNENEVVYINELPTQDRYHQDRLTGYIELEIETLTPIYIRDSLNKDEIKKEEDLKKKNKDNKFINPNFFSPYGDGKYAIPGSSMRGMIRSLVEIVSFGNFGFVDDDKRLYYRGVADKYLADIYRKYMISESNENYLPKMKAGYLYKKSQDNYIIKPAKEIEDTQWYKVNYAIVKGYKNHDKIFFIPQKIKNHPHRSIPSGKLRYPLIEDVSKNDEKNKVEGRLIVSGHMQKKHMHWIINLPEEGKEIQVPEQVIEEYNGDSSREGKANLLDDKHNKEISDLGIPCFYLSKTNEKNEEEIIAFGHTGMFRLPYEKTIGELIPIKQKPITQENSKYENLDYANAIFGFVYNPKKTDQKNANIVKAVSGRVSFSDFISDKVELFEELVPRILSNPKPTTFQHYLEQTGVSENGKERMHYNSNTRIRGNKLYWHIFNNADNFIETEYIVYEKDNSKVAITQKELLSYVKRYNNGNDPKELKAELKNLVIKKLGRNDIKDSDIKEHFSQYTIIKPINKASFKGKIYFENLSDNELGCLLFALDLPEGCAHKIGMGKPLGLGSIKISSKVYISNRNNQKNENGRYYSLKSEWDFIPKSKKSIVDYKNAFVKNILKEDNDSSWESLWSHPRLAELKRMLDWENRPSYDKTEYMNMQNKDFRDRKILSQPTKYNLDK